jgi:hypothetical protein
MTRDRRRRGGRGAWQREARWLKQQGPDVIRGYVQHVDLADAPRAFKRTIAGLAPPAPSSPNVAAPAPPDRPSRPRVSVEWR